MNNKSLNILIDNLQAFTKNIETFQNLPKIKT